MKTVAVYEVKASLSHLLDQVEAGEEIKITRRGVAIARIVPDHPPEKPNMAALIAEIKATRINCTLDDMDWREMAEEGRD